MKVYDVSTPEYLASGEFDRIADYFDKIKQSRTSAFLARHPGYSVRPRYKPDPEQKKHILEYLAVSNMPFYDDLVVETILHKDNCGYMEPKEFAYQVNCFAKTIFHRMKWSAGNPKDKFLQFVWDDWKQTQPNNEFDLLEKIADQKFEDCENLYQYHVEFVLNPDYEFVNETDMRKLFDELVRLGVLTYHENDLYQIYENVTFDDADTDSKSRYHSGQISKINELKIRAMVKQRRTQLEQVQSKINFIPQDRETLYDGIWCEHLLNNKIWFIPQFLVFYNKVC
jgi:hypothetical protein